MNVPLRIRNDDVEETADAADTFYALAAVPTGLVALCVGISVIIHGAAIDRYRDPRRVFHHEVGNIGSMLGRLFVHIDRHR